MSGPSINRAKLVDVACKLNLGDTLEKILQAIDREQAADAEAEKWWRRWREIFESSETKNHTAGWLQFLSELRSAQPASEKRKVRARVTVHNNQYQWSLVENGYGGGMFHGEANCRRNLEVIMAAAGATVVWEEGNE